MGSGVSRMANAVKPKGMSVGSALLLIVVVGVAAITISVKGTPHKTEIPSDDDLHENITLSVLFTPQKRTRTVNVQAHVEGVRIVPPLGGPEFLPLLQSPWNLIVRVPKGAQVSLYAFQDEAPKPGNLDCLITLRGQTVSHGHRFDPGSIRCYVNRVGG